MGISFFKARQPIAGQSVLIFGASLSHSDTSHSEGLLSSSDRPDAVSSTRQHTKLKRDRYPRPRQDSNRQSQQARGDRSMSLTARQLIRPYIISAFKIVAKLEINLIKRTVLKCAIVLVG